MTAPGISVVSTPKHDRFESPFLHISSPKQLKSMLLESARKSAEKEKEREKDTPRTHARRRLAGEVDSPVGVRKRRGFRDAAPAGGPAGLLGAPTAEMEDELGETPVKGEAFALLDDFSATGDAAKGEPKGRDLLSIFRRAAEDLEPATKVKAKAKEEGKHVEKGKTGEAELGWEKGKRASKRENGRQHKRKASTTERPGKKARSSSIPPDAPQADANASIDASIDAEAEAEALVPSTPPPVTRTRAPRRTPHRTRVLQLSDDEWDPEASPRRIMITGTKRAAVSVRNDVIASDDEGGVQDEEGGEEGVEEGEEGAEEGEEGGEAVPDGAEVVEVETDGDGTHTRELLSLLSLRSSIARSGERMADLRVRALLDPTSAAAAALRARRRGQDVFACGEGMYEEEYLEIEEVDAVAEGDDDWESDPEGWKEVRDEEEW